jgi:hypothetical protein
MLLIAGLIVGCGSLTTRVPKVVIIASDKEIGFIAKGSSLTNSPLNYYLVPEARMQEILHKLEEK